MRYPQMDEYHLAIQNPRTVFEDSELRVATVEKDQLGLPRVSSGGFALTYRLNGTNKAWAVRCFHKDVPNRQQRYAAISEFLARNPTPFFIPASYLSNGILVDGTRYPITKMSWVNGETLYKYIERNINNLSAVRALAEQFQELIFALEHLGTAHGDLQHGNILVANGKLVLVDYDGMYVPALAGFRGEERGHVNYQHPQRNTEFGPDIDRFSAIAIYLALKAITPTLWHKYSTGENLLFKQDDFRSPDTSRLLAELEFFPDLKTLIQRFRLVCKNSLAKVPRLADFLNGNVPTSVSEPIKLATCRSQYRILDANKRDELITHVGQRVTIVGKITEHSLKQTQTHPPKPYVFLSFGDWQKGCFRLILWSETLQLFSQLQKSTASYNQQWVSVTGLLGKFTSGLRTHPQIIIETPSEIEVLAGGEEEAKERLASYVEPKTEPPTEAESPIVGKPSPVGSVTPSPISQPSKVQSTTAPTIATDKISDLYKNWTGPTITRPQVAPPQAAPVVPKPTPPPPPSKPVQSLSVQTQPAAVQKIKGVEICPHCGAMVRSDHLKRHIKKNCPVLKKKRV